MAETRLVDFYIDPSDGWHATVTAPDVDSARKLACDTFEAQRRLRGWAPVVFVTTRLEWQQQGGFPRYTFKLEES